MPSQSTMTLLIGVKHSKTFELSSRFFFSNICMLFFHQYWAKRINVLFFILIYFFFWWLFFRAHYYIDEDGGKTFVWGKHDPVKKLKRVDKTLGTWIKKIHLLNCRFSWWEIKTSMNLIQKAFTLFFYIKWRILCNFFSLLGFTSQNIGEYLPYYFEFEKKNLKLIFYVQFVWFYPINLNESMVFS
jgi:hypothetical protein